MIAIGCDHGGLHLKDAIRNYLVSRDLVVSDLGTMNVESVDYPDFAAKVAQAVSSQTVAKGILICGTGIGMSIVANKFPGIRAALVWDDFTAQMAKEHNNANILVVGGRILTVEDACRLVGIWLDTVFAGDRHQGRLDKIAQIEEDIRLGRL